MIAVVSCLALVTAFGTAISPSGIPLVCRLSQLASCDKL